MSRINQRIAKLETEGQPDQAPPLLVLFDDQNEAGQIGEQFGGVRPPNLMVLTVRFLEGRASPAPRRDPPSEP